MSPINDPRASLKAPSPGSVPMTRRLSLLAPLLLTLAATAAPAQMMAVPPALPPQRPTPLLYVRFSGPAGMRTTFYQGRPEGRDFDAPVSVGMRTGYPY